ncbi:GFA family protein [Pseudovibrio ascidiaceicola]|uniref:GFA family protein n=1 Tax=Pseudovibrio ascidiaceicola TaxID=285279 RepID=UPI000D686423|nr:GFA family protein [Pseudovibrio ascidiaceicola]
MSDLRIYKAKCLCGEVSFKAEAPQKDIGLCHCTMCRRWNSGPFHAIAIPFDALKVESGEENISYYRSSDYAKRAFCNNCGSSLFYHGDKIPEISHELYFSAGLLEEPTGSKLAGHIFCASKGDYYEIEGDLPQHETV